MTTNQTTTKRAPYVDPMLAMRREAERTGPRDNKGNPFPNHPDNGKLPTWGKFFDAHPELKPRNYAELVGA